MINAFTSRGKHDLSGPAENDLGVQSNGQGERAGEEPAALVRRGVGTAM